MHLWIYQAVYVYCMLLLSCTAGFLDIQHSGWRCGHCCEKALDILKSDTNMCNSNSNWFRFPGKKLRDIVEGSKIYSSPSPQVSPSFHPTSLPQHAFQHQRIGFCSWHVEIDGILLFLQFKLPHSTFLIPLQELKLILYVWCIIRLFNMQYYKKI